MEVTELLNNDILKNAFKESNDLKIFYLCFPEIDFIRIKRFNKKIFTSFSSTYIWEQTFSIVKFRKHKYYSWLCDKHVNLVLRISTTFNMTANIQQKLTRKIQSQKSY